MNLYVVVVANIEVIEGVGGVIVNVVILYDIIVVVVLVGGVDV